MNDTATIASSLAFYPADMTALRNRLAELEASGVAIRRARLISALVHTTGEADLLKYAEQMAAAEGSDAAEVGIAGRPAVHFLKSDIDKLERVKRQLVRRGSVPHANRAFIVRALVRWSPSGAALAPAVRRYLDEFPYKPRGLSKMRIEARKKSRG